jgi:hypothetical protein
MKARKERKKITRLEPRKQGKKLRTMEPRKQREERRKIYAKQTLGILRNI